MILTDMPSENRIIRGLFPENESTLILVLRGF
jgi:hypothetical protein